MLEFKRFIDLTRILFSYRAWHEAGMPAPAGQALIRVMTELIAVEMTAAEAKAAAEATAAAAEAKAEAAEATATAEAAEKNKEYNVDALVDEVAFALLTVMRHTKHVEFLHQADLLLVHPHLLKNKASIHWHLHQYYNDAVIAAVDNYRRALQDDQNAMAFVVAMTTAGQSVGGAKINTAAAADAAKIDNVSRASKAVEEAKRHLVEMQDSAWWRASRVIQLTTRFDNGAPSSSGGGGGDDNDSVAIKDPPVWAVQTEVWIAHVQLGLHRHMHVGNGKYVHAGDFADSGRFLNIIEGRRVLERIVSQNLIVGIDNVIVLARSFMVSQPIGIQNANDWLIVGQQRIMMARHMQRFESGTDEIINPLDAAELRQVMRQLHGIMTPIDGDGCTVVDDDDDDVVGGSSRRYFVPLGQYMSMLAMFAETANDFARLARHCQRSQLGGAQQFWYRCKNACGERDSRLAEEADAALSNLCAALPNSAIHITAQSDCSICQDLLTGSSADCLLTLQCGHSFHQHCIEDWFESQRQRRQCPSCRCVNGHRQQQVL
jgi:hypothetical protein